MTITGLAPGSAAHSILSGAGRFDEIAAIAANALGRSRMSR
jgi:hypothetical protein